MSVANSRSTVCFYDDVDDDNELLPNINTPMKQTKPKNLSVHCKRTTVRFDDSDDNDDDVDEVYDDNAYVNDVDYITCCDDRHDRRNQRQHDRRIETGNRRYESHKNATCARDSISGHLAGNEERGRSHDKRLNNCSRSHRRRRSSTSTGSPELIATVRIEILPQTAF